MTPSHATGFTGTGQGMTALQAAQAEILLSTRVILHHGECVGADYEAGVIARRLGLHIVGHPPVKQHDRADCDVDERREQFPYLVRNTHIVDETAELIAAPLHAYEEVRSGVWHTVRYARNLGRPILIISPDGSVTEENPGR